MSKITTNESITLKMSRDPETQKVQTELFHEAPTDKGLQLYFTIFQIMLNDKEMIEAYTNAALDIAQKMKEEKEVE